MIKALIYWDHKSTMDATQLRFLYQYWDYTCRGFGMEPADFSFIDVDGTLPLFSPPNGVFPNEENALEYYSEFTPVYVHGQGKTELPAFDHPQDALYIMGPNYDSLTYPESALSVSIPAWDDLWNHVALGIVLYDRTLK